MSPPCNSENTCQDKPLTPCVLCGRSYDRVSGGERAAQQHVCPQPLPIGTRVLGRTQLLHCELTAHSSDRGPGSKDKSELTGQLRTDGMTSTPDISEQTCSAVRGTSPDSGQRHPRTSCPGKGLGASESVCLSGGAGSTSPAEGPSPQPHRSERQPWAAFSCFSH